MNTSMDSLSIEIESVAKDSNSAVDLLITKLDKLRTSLQNVLKESDKFSSLKNNISSAAKSTTNRVSTKATSTSNDYGSYHEQLYKLGIGDLGDSNYAKLKSTVQTTNSEISKFVTKNNEVVSVAKTTKNGVDNVKVSVKTLGDASKNTTNLWGSLANGFTKSVAKISAVYLGLRKLASVLSTSVKEAANYEESLNLFSVTLGDRAEEANAWVEKFSNALYLDPANVRQYMGSFNSLITGLGVGSDKAYIMSQNLTQLTYDLASFKNLDIDTAFRKLQSATSGEIEPLRNVGIALSEATLQELALSMGINKNVADMNEAEKAQLRYIQILKSSTEWQGDMGATLVTPANALRILRQQFTLLSRAVGSVFIPILMKLVPYVMVITQALTKLANKIALIFGYKIQDVDYNRMAKGIGGIGDNVRDLGDNASSTAKKLNTMLAPFDDLNVVQNQTAGAGFGAGLGGSSDDLGAMIDGYDALAKLNDGFQKGMLNAEKTLKRILPVVTAIGAAFLTWKISKKLLSSLKTLQSLTPKNLSFSVSILGVANFLADFDRFRKYLEDILDNGATFTNVVGLLSEFTGGIGDVFTILGRTKLGGALKVVQGIGEITSAISDIANNGINWSNVTTTIRGLTNVAIGIGLFTGNIKLAGAMTAIQGFTTIIDELKNNWTAIKSGDWSGVDKATLLIGALQVLGGVLVAFDAFNKLKKTTTIADSPATMSELSTTTSKLIPSLTSLAKNLGLGILIMGEVTAAAVLFVGAIWLLGKELEQVGIAWQPVLDNGKNIAIAIGVGTGLLIAVGGATALLGMATVASGGTLPIAIGLGTAMLVAMSAATAIFIASVSLIAKQINNQLAPQLSLMNQNAPTITTGLNNYTSFLKKFATIIYNTTKLSVLSSFASFITTIVGWFSGDPIKKFAKDVNKTYTQTRDLNEKLRTANPELANAITLVSEYINLVKTLDRVVGNNKVSNISGNMFINMKDAGKKLITGFVDGINSQKSSLTNAVNSIYNAINTNRAWQVGYNFGRNIGNGINNGIKNTLNSTIKLLNKSGSVSNQYTIRAYAAGGYPETGEFFVANENGPEMIGKIGNRSAVANNDQIETSLTNALITALNNYDFGGGNSPTTIYIGNKKVYEGYGDYVNGENDRYGTNTIRI